ncbi:MAG: CpaF family protein [Bradymonadales bacterium]|nr:MAG: CpaF family protein [Bradymonadales bacterium]
MNSGIQLQIQELTEKRRYRNRVVRVNSESITIGSDGSQDIDLTAFDQNFEVEIKFDGKDWWILNLHRSPQLRINGRLIEKEAKISDSDRILIHEHQILVRFEEQGSEKASTYSFHHRFASDQELWRHLLEEKEFDEVLINGPSKIFVDYQGQLLLSPWKFKSKDFIPSIIRAQGKTEGWVSWQINRSLRLQAALPPIVDEAHLSIRKARQSVFSLTELEDRDFMSPELARSLREAVKRRESILISGGTSTGKTVLLRSLVQEVPEDQRVIIVEEEAETNWPHPHAVSIESGRGNVETSVKECLRFRPDRLIISEIRGGEAFDFLQAINTGHAGSMTTIHANSPREALQRIETLILARGLAVSPEAVRQQLSQAIRLVVQLERDDSGHRRISQIMRVTGIQNSVILMGDVSKLEGFGIQTELKQIK